MTERADPSLMTACPDAVTSPGQCNVTPPARQAPNASYYNILWQHEFRIRRYALPVRRRLRPAPPLVGPIPEQPLEPRRTIERQQHPFPYRLRRPLSRAIRGRDDRLHGSAEACIGIGVDPGLVWIPRHGPPGNGVADIPVDPEAGQQRRDQHLPRLMIGGGEQEARVPQAVG